MFTRATPEFPEMNRSPLRYSALSPKGLRPSSAPSSTYMASTSACSTSSLWELAVMAVGRPLRREKWTGFSAVSDSS